MVKTVGAKPMGREGAADEVTEAQRELVHQKLAEYRANPDEPTATLADIKRDLKLSLR